MQPLTSEEELACSCQAPAEPGDHVPHARGVGKSDCATPRAYPTRTRRGASRTLRPGRRLRDRGFAFDSEEQPDQRHFSGSGRPSPEWRAELARSMERVFDKIFAAAVEYKLEVIVLARFGAGAFSVNYPGHIYE
ncbi:unnamed protein product, partial [Prorocentrum cordatum]